MAIRHGTMASSVAIPPSVTIGNATNFNQNLATLNATVNGQGFSTTVKFQYSTSSGFSSYTEVNATPSSTSDNNVAVYANITGLSEGTVYYFRCVVTNGVGSATSNSNNFTTWSLQVYERSTSGGTTFTIPTVTPTGGSAVAVSIQDIIVFGGGGGGGIYVGGGGGGYQNISSRSVTGSRSITTSVGAGGVGWQSGVTNSTAGSSSSISGDITTVSASGGGSDSGNSNVAPSSGNGNAGGSNSAPYDYTPNDKGGLSNTGYGGGGGAGGVGGNGTANSSGTTGGNGGTGVSITSGGVTRTGGAGGGGHALNWDGGPGTDGVQGSNNTYGSGGNHSLYTPNGGQAGYIRFRYYAASALA